MSQARLTFDTLKTDTVIKHLTADGLTYSNQGEVLPFTTLFLVDFADQAEYEKIQRSFAAAMREYATGVP